MKKYQEEVFITICTPTYNRANRLHRLYDSLCNQTYPNSSFEWLIIDDGSTDDSEKIIQYWISEEKITILYYKKENGGKHRALNEGIGVAKGELFFIVDSDDFLPTNALDIVIKYYLPIRNNSNIIGVVGLMGNHKGEIIGSKKFDKDIIDSNLIERRSKYGVTADMAKVIKTEKFRDFLFPDIPQEKFVAESIIWNRMAIKYDFRYFNEIIYIAEYIEGGLSNNSIRNRRKNPIYATTLYRELVKNPKADFKTRIKAAINYWRFALCKKNIVFQNIKLLANPIYLITLPLGAILNIKDRVNNDVNIKKINK
ncbi:sugar transferase [Capnocytophaga stomatis]|uniref:glycosyltransferase family 2 protein n=1 Tax=Capnocytophaga stomatis TaxID=1848904 RepID=UPI00194DDBE6|nr:glycosyltransferase family A protein [Capnocytophaga stomatis]GIJ97700.1 sugar transferase [Capnocytophaga stomatis]GIM48683.1 sugar transferase [Capnocytophaga stomatis]